VASLDTGEGQEVGTCLQVVTIDTNGHQRLRQALTRRWVSLFDGIRMGLAVFAQKAYHDSIPLDDTRCVEVRLVCHTLQ
jgi:hypothetical protein